MGVLLVKRAKCDRGDLELRERPGAKVRERRILASYTAPLVSPLTPRVNEKSIRTRENEVFPYPTYYYQTISSDTSHVSPRPGKAAIEPNYAVFETHKDTHQRLPAFCIPESLQVSSGSSTASVRQSVFACITSALHP